MGTVGEREECEVADPARPGSRNKDWDLQSDYCFLHFLKMYYSSSECDDELVRVLFFDFHGFEY